MIWLVALAAFVLGGCDNVDRSLVFFTTTSAGLEVGIDPSSSSGKIMLGYKRAEGVINPVYQPPPKETIRESGPGGSAAIFPMMADDGTQYAGDAGESLYWNTMRVVTVDTAGFLRLYSGGLTYRASPVLDSKGQAAHIEDGVVKVSGGASDFLYIQPAVVVNPQGQAPQQQNPRDYVGGKDPKAVTAAAFARNTAGSERVHTRTEWRPVNEVYRSKAYSVMAKIAGEAGGRGAVGPSGSVEGAGKVAQWFATGRAADLLASNEYAAAALTGSNAVAQAISANDRFGARLGGDWDIEALAQLNAIVNDLQKSKDPKVQKLLADLDAASNALVERVGTVKLYTLGRDENIAESTWSRPSAGGLRAIEDLRSRLRNSETLLGAERWDRGAKKFKDQALFATDGSGFNATVVSQMDQALDQVRADQRKVDILIRNDFGFVTALEAAFRAWSELYFKEAR